MISQPPKQKGFLARYWGLLLAIGLVVGLVLLAGLGVGAYFLLRSNVEASSIELSTEKPEFGKDFTAKVDLENKGILGVKEHQMVLLVDGKEMGSDDVTLDSKQSETLTFDMKGLSAGKHTVSIGGKEQEFTVYLPADLKVTGLEVTPDQLIVGEKATAKVTVKNTGELPGDFEGKLEMDGTELTVVKGAVEPGAEIVIETEFTPDERGDHTLSLGDQDAKITVVTPADITVTGLKLSKEFPAPKEEITATVSLRNSGDLAGKYTVVLNINGAADQQKEVTVEANSTMDVAFAVSESAAGEYSVQSGDYSQQMQVVVITRPKNGTFLVSTAKATTSGRLGYMQIYNNTKKDAMFVLVRRDKPKVVVLAVYVRAGQNMMRFFVKNSGLYIAYYTVGGNFDSKSRRFLSGAEYYKYPQSVDFTNYWYHFQLPHEEYTKIDESAFPK